MKLLLEDYRHFLQEAETLSNLLELLGKLRGHAQVSDWQAQIVQGTWPEFVTSLLENHYDLCYRRPGSPTSNYQAPAEQFALPDCSMESYHQAARQLRESEAAFSS